MKRLMMIGAMALAASQVGAQQASQRVTATPNAATSAQGKYPLAAAAGQDSGAIRKAPSGAANTGPLAEKGWKYGNAYDVPPGMKLWNPVRLKMMQGGKVTGGTVQSATDPETYCAMANAGYDFTWTEMQHNTRDWNQVARMWAACPHAKAVPGVRIAYTDEREIQHALDAGALVLLVPTVDTVEEAIAARDFTFFPPLGKRSLGAGQAFGQDMWGKVPGGYRATANDNIVLILLIETLEGLKNAAAIAKVPGVTAIFAAQGDLANFSGYPADSPDFERAINIVHDAAIGAGKRLCGPMIWVDRPDFTCFQAGSEVAAITRGAAAELGPLANTQAKVEVGPLSGN